ncbi:hypothetical protein SteCoe_35803 [Stentor coeruleus]|uniref:Uncharacterized protein n=1 Tax=Stentor coeruleus TaxID=5963 RepID=A0A1R2ARK1_9CILI|nr:hypothetical protein SteCoe_35803 [Stentor coeruleus]
MSKRTYYNTSLFGSSKAPEDYGKVITELEKKIESRSSPHNEQYGFLLSEKPKFSKLDYAEELKKQVLTKNAQKEIEKIEKLKPAISEDFHGYPNIPQTPPYIRRQRELEIMNKLSIGLAEQVIEKKKNVIAYKNLELEKERESNTLDVKKYFEYKEGNQNKKNIEKLMLINAWDQAKKARELQCILENVERKGIVPRTVRESPKEQSIEEFKKEDENLRINLEVGSTMNYEKINPEVTSEIMVKSKTKFNVKEKAERLKENMENKAKGTYHYKIKQLIQNAKIQREQERNNFKKFMSPGPILHHDGSKKISYHSQKAFKFR